MVDGRAALDGCDGRSRQLRQPDRLVPAARVSRDRADPRSPSRRHGASRGRDWSRGSARTGAAPVGGDTILGADDKAGIAEVLEALRTATVRPPIELAVSRQEEVGLLGVKELDFARLRAKRGFLMDNDTLDTIIIGGPTYITLDVAVTGRSAHAGMEPEKGINAIRAAAKAIAALRLGRLDHQTTANVGVIQGGMIRNGVPASCTFLAECRSADHPTAAALAEEMVGVIRREVEAAGATVEIVVDEQRRRLRHPRGGRPCRSPSRLWPRSASKPRPCS